jgi:hypothetical protein
VGGIKPIETWYRGYRFRSRQEARWAVFYDAAGITWRYEQEGYDLSAVELPNEPGALEQVHFGHIRENPAAGNEIGIPRWYLPDFYLPKQKCWVEVKTRRPSRLEAEKMARLAWGKGENGYIFWDLRPPKELQGSTSKEIIRNAFHSALGVEVFPNPWEPYEGQSVAAWIIQFYHPPGVDLEAEVRVPAISMDHDYQWCECPRCGLLGITNYGNARLLRCGCLVKSSAERASLSYWDRAPVYTDDSPRLMAAYMAARQARFEHGENPQQHVLKAKLDRIKEILDSDDIDED